ncbi:phosphonate ABC transporter, permease protein PhnE [Candidatus Acetothermia bacterium]|nr:phosphonate ABC transporter, permease protein PhnE [Candidatus Acetothermia bacterium]MCI2431428.1 phosphonate ABC transporter, permease protein PhnE [Candidatus Acetothermia bacterium]MCI2436703.1 phosphonate ABC transporter, permease protein PhnE [Candidatus Acetothermia bacterium]
MAPWTEISQPRQLPTWLKSFSWPFTIVALLLLYAWAMAGVEFNPLLIFQYGGKFFELMGRMWPPDFSPLPHYWRPLFQTLQMAILGTFFGTLMALPLVVFGSQLVVRSAWVYWPVRLLMNVLRTIPDLLYAVLFVVAMGFGPIAGVGALSFFACAIIAKLTSESADNINPKPIEAIEATGANKLQVIRYAVIPQILPAFLDHTLYVFELNVRIATVMGYVGAGGIGAQLTTALEWRNYPQVMAIVLMIFATVLLIDLIANRIRDALVHGVIFPRALRWLGLGVVAGLILWSASSLEVNLDRLIAGVGYFNNLVGAMRDPNFEYFELAVQRMIQSLQIALVGTTISFLLSVPVGFLAARSHTGVPIPLALVFKQVPNTIRAFPELILAIFFIATFGPGALPGVLAIAIHSIGMLGKFNAEIVEKIRKEPVEAIQATGASRLQVFRYAILPQVLPEFLALFIYRLEINVRAASVLGIVGAGGIGSLIVEAQGLRDWGIVGVCLMVIIPVVMVIDFFSARVRKRLIEG